MLSESQFSFIRDFLEKAEELSKEPFPDIHHNKRFLCGYEMEDLLTKDYGFAKTYYKAPNLVELLNKGDTNTIIRTIPTRVKSYLNEIGCSYFFEIDVEKFYLKESIKAEYEQIASNNVVDSLNEIKDAIITISYSIDNDSKIKNDKMKSIVESVKRITETNQIIEQDIYSISQNAKELTLMAKYNLSEDEKLNKAKLYASKKIRRKKGWIIFISILLGIVATFFTGLFIYDKQSANHDVFVDFILVVGPLFVDLILQLFKHAIIKTEDEYIEKYFKNNK